MAGDDDVPWAPPLSAEDYAALDAANLAHALELSKNTTTTRIASQTSSSSSSSVPISTSTSTSSRLRPVYPAGKAPTQSIGDKQPRQPKMTTQMSPAWMRQYKDNSSGASIIPRSTSVTTGRPLLIKRLQHLPEWPQWSSQDCPEVLARLELEGDLLELLDQKLRLWTEIGVDYEHRLTADCVIFLRAPGAPCQDFDNIFKSFTSQPGHIRNNLPTIAEVSEPSAIVSKPSALRALTADDNDDDNDDLPALLMPSLSTTSPSVRPRLSVTIPTTPSLGVTSTTTSSTRTSFTPLWVVVPGFYACYICYF
ncbi:hypothetical protein B0H14DRAFT_3423795 [Mycena olivaceomarginata]|nr:hypothetical protein B0H14DRAFT_3423795 [Mycena olivaceomarginata]